MSTPLERFALNKQIHTDLNLFGERLTKLYQVYTGLEHPGDDKGQYGRDYIECLNHLYEVQHTLYANEMQKGYEEQGAKPWEGINGIMSAVSERSIKRIEVQNA